MQALRNRERICRLAFGWYQILGGCFGIVLMLELPFIIPFSHWLEYILLLCSLFTFGFSVLCGIKVIRGSNNAYNFSYINQCLQILKFSLSGFGFHYVSGISLFAGVRLTNSDYIFELGTSSWLIEWDSGSSVKEIHFNLIAILLLVVIDSLKKENKKHNDIIESM